LFTAEEFAEAFDQAQATIAFVSPTVVRQLLAIAADGRVLFPEAPVLVSGGAPIFADEKREAVRRLSANFHQQYGSAATGPMAILRPDEMTEHAASVGRPLPLVDMEAVDDDGRVLGPHIPGRLRCRGPGIGSPMGSGDSADDFRDEWYYPGEIAALDERGYIFLQGRTSEVIFRGGTKIAPNEVEAVLQAHDAVVEAAVVARASAGNEQDIVAYVVAARPIGPGEILAHCRIHLTAYKVPREIHLVRELPRTSSGKVDKRMLAGAKP
jgi:acyl-coenzyme A synthetase/AMP-(fatty) acid ligase